MTAKVPLKVHLRLRFQNLGKPRTAGLCGRAAGACDCVPLSCAFIERPSPLENPAYKVRFFANKHSRKYRQKVTATMLFQTASHPVFQLLAQMAHVRFHRRKWVYTLGFRRKMAHSGLHGETRAFRMGGGITTLGAFHTFWKPCVARCQNGKLCRFWGLVGGAPKEHRKPAEQRCAYARRCSAGVAAPLGCAALTVEFLAFLLLLKTTIANSLTPWYYGVTKSESIG